MEVIVVGGGIVGSLTAYGLRKGGLEVTLVDAGKRGEATMASAGLLVQEVWPWVSAWATESLERYPTLIQELQAATGHTIPFALEGVFVHASMQAPVPPDWFGLARPAHGGYVHPPKLKEALRQAFRRMGGRLVEAEAVQVEPGRVQLKDEALKADWVVVTAGAWSARLLPLDIHPLKGEALLLEASPPPAPLFAGEGYALPREGGIYLGATARETWLEGVELDGLRELLDYARTTFPHLASAGLRDTLWGFRPGGRLTVARVEKGLYVAAGHGPYGVTLAPATAARVAEALGVRPA
jgi:glycine oxidase